MDIKSIFVSVLFLIGFGFSSAQPEVNPVAYDPLVTQLPNGNYLRANQRTSRNGVTFYAFRSIPYATPPTGSLRFQPPQPHPGWNGIRDVSDDIPICAQSQQGSNRQVGKEDCLYLNVFTQNIKPFSQKPVLVYFHGGSYMQGDATEFFHNPNFLLDEDIVLVSAAFRVGILGLCNLGFSVNRPLISNAGFRDQVFVLQWIKTNIASFGGNPNSVTILGQSSGASSAFYHLFSPLSRGLFHRIIAESGTPLNSWALGKPGSGEAIATNLGITDTDPITILNQLQQVPLVDLLDAQNPTFGLISANRQGFSAPIIDVGVQSPVIPVDPRTTLEGGTFNKSIPILFGYNDMEGIIIDLQNVMYRQYSNIYDVRNLIPYDLNNNNQNDLDAIAAQIRQFYFNGTVPSEDTRSPAMVNLITDTGFLYPIYRAARMLGSGRSLAYFYRFSMDTSLNFYKRLTPMTAQYKGASHADELGYIFQTAITPAITSGSIEDRKISEMVRLWTNFAKNSNPTPLTLADILNLFRSLWSPLIPSPTFINYYDLSNANPSVSRINPENARIQFWDNIYKTLISADIILMCARR